MLFYTIHRLVNPFSSIPTELLSSEKCNEFATYFKRNIFNIRNNIVTLAFGGCLSPSLHRRSASTMSTFSLNQSNELSEVVLQLYTATCALDPILTKVYKNVFSCSVVDVLDSVNASLEPSTHV